MLDLAHTTDVEITLITNRLPWLGHVALMPDERSIKALLYGEESSRRVGRPFLRFLISASSNPRFRYIRAWLTWSPRAIPS